MFSKELEEVIDAALADGTITDTERRVLHKRAVAEGVDPDELDVVIDGRLAKMKKQEDWLRPAPPKNLENEKYGNVLKCPSCGAQVVGGTAVCPECGYTFSNVGSNSSIEKLNAKIEKIQEEREGHASWNIFADDHKRERLFDTISNFPVPNTRADLLEFLTAIMPKAKSTGDSKNMSTDDYSLAYWQLFHNCINKARISFHNDKDFDYFMTFFENEEKRAKGISGFFRKIF